jgi:hypothetical protein
MAKAKQKMIAVSTAQAALEHNDEAVRREERERCARLVPTNWCDPLLTGEGAARVPLDCRGVEALLRGIQDRIRNDPAAR